jgi:hypothetical protein
MRFLDFLSCHPVADPELNRHLARGLPFLDRVLGETKRDGAVVSDSVVHTPGWKSLSDGPLDLQASVLMSAAWVCSRMASLGWGEWTYTAKQVVEASPRRKLPWTPEDVCLLLDFALGVDASLFTDLARVAVTAAEQLDGPLDFALSTRARDVLGKTQGLERQEGAGEKLAARLNALLGQAPPGQDASGPPDPRLFVAGDRWAQALQKIVGEEFRNANGLNPLLVHMKAGGALSKPNAKWRKRCRELLPAAGRAEELIRAMLSQVLALQELVDERGWYIPRPFLSDPSADFARGAVWVAAELGAGWAPDLLGDLAIHCAKTIRGQGPRCSKLSNASIHVLGALEGMKAVTQLSRVRGRVKNLSILKQVEKALQAASERAGMTKEQLLEASVPAFGLDPSGSKRVPFGDAAALLAIENDDVLISWTNAKGTPVKAPPAEAKALAEEMKSLKSEAREIDKALQAERMRLEGLLVDERVWPYAEWDRLYRSHPVTGRLARRLIWIFREADGPPRAAFPVDAGFVDAAGAPVSIDPARSKVQLWHPIFAPAEETRAWRRFLLVREVAQPFKQAFREVYLLTPAEERTDTYSNRFAAHILRYTQAHALMKTRGWGGCQLGFWDGGFDAAASRDYGSRGFRAEFFISLVETATIPDTGVPELCATDQVRFFRLEAGGWVPARVAEVPPLVFTEAMRDVDLFVGVSSIGNDPSWQDRGDAGHVDYWRAASFGELTESASIRREALLQLVPRLRIADRLSVADKFLVVRGDLKTYKIHLGSANILMEPNDQYLCIVADRGSALNVGPGKVFLPFEEGGGRLSMILSKAFLLAEDLKITDPTILRQLGRPVPEQNQ